MLTLKRIRDVFKREVQIASSLDDSNSYFELQKLFCQLLKKKRVSSHIWEQFIEWNILEKSSWSQQEALEHIQSFLDAGVDPNIITNGFETPLIIKWVNKFPFLIPLLLRYGANVNATDSFRWTIFHCIADSTKHPDQHVELLESIWENCQMLPLCGMKTQHGMLTPMHLLSKQNQSWYLLHPKTLKLLP
jgi:hypothetical protein